jgi:hypothetical protein
MQNERRKETKHVTLKNNEAQGRPWKEKRNKVSTKDTGNNMTSTGSYLWRITLNVSGLNFPNREHSFADTQTRSNCMSSVRASGLRAHSRLK